MRGIQMLTEIKYEPISQNNICVLKLAEAHVLVGCAQRCYTWPIQQKFLKWSRIDYRELHSSGTINYRFSLCHYTISL